MSNSLPSAAPTVTPGLVLKGKIEGFALTSWLHLLAAVYVFRHVSHDSET